MRPRVVRALTVALVVAGAAGAMALPKLVLDTPSSKAHEIAFPAP
ncbi:MAG: hypothetical protein QOJ43_1015, partial [Gaiellaceae bacterium]|nr:hypothetical protein [Gaiellaceae bacterium]